MFLFISALAEESHHSFIHPSKDQPLYHGFPPPNTKFLHMSLPLAAPTASSRLATLRLKPSTLSFFGSSLPSRPSGSHSSIPRVNMSPGILFTYCIYGNRIPSVSYNILDFKLSLALFWMFYAFFWVIPRRLNCICRRFGTLCLFHLHRRVGMKNDYLYHPMAHPEEIMQLLITCFPYIYRVATHYAKTRSDQLSFTSEHASSFFSSYSS